MNTIDKLPDVSIHTDGSYLSHLDRGSCCVHIQQGIHEITLVYGEKHTTSNRMEMIAVIVALEALKEKCNVTIYSDSKYVINPFNNKWIDKWKKNNWKGSENQDIKNKDLWEILLKLIDRHNVKFVWVKGHSNNEKNNYCDKIAKQVAVKFDEYAFSK